MRPRLAHRKLKPTFGFGRAEAPCLYALLDRCCAELGCRVPDRISIGADFNASTWRAGLAQRRVLRLGAPLWTVLTGPEQLALLGHELGHQVNGDTTRTLLASSAWRSLSEWTSLFHPDRVQGSGPGTGSLRRGGPIGLASDMLGPLFILLLTLPFFGIAVGLRAVLTRLQLRCGQRAEYLADELGARLAGTEAALSLHCKMVLRASLPIFVRARRGGPVKADPATLWTDFSAYVDSMPENEFQRRLLAAARTALR